MSIAIESLQEAIPDLNLLRPGTQEFNDKRQIYFAPNPRTPLAIARPKSAQEVQQLIRYVKANKIPFTVRSGGHDVYGRAIVENTLCIDMRDINFVEVTADRKTALVGGGVLSGKLVDELSKERLVTPVGNVGDVGVVGWTTCGGYGPMSCSFGLGVDQIQGAQVVTADGEIVEADEKMLMGIRGAGGNFGIITALTIKIYELEKILSGMYILDTTPPETGQLFKTFMTRLQTAQAKNEVDRELYIFPSILNVPRKGKILSVGLLWSSDEHDRGRRNIETVRKMLDPHSFFMESVQSITPAEHVAMMSSFVGKATWGGPQSLSYRDLTPKRWMS